MKQKQNLVSDCKHSKRKSAREDWFPECGGNKNKPEAR